MPPGLVHLKLSLPGVQMGHSEQLFKGLPDSSGTHQRDLSAGCTTWEFLLPGHMQLPKKGSSAHKTSVTSVKKPTQCPGFLDCDKNLSTVRGSGSSRRLRGTAQASKAHRARTQTEPCLCNELCLARSEPAPASSPPNLLQLIKYQGLFGVWQHIRLGCRSLLVPGERARRAPTSFNRDPRWAEPLTLMEFHSDSVLKFL